MSLKDYEISKIDFEEMIKNGEENDLIVELEKDDEDVLDVCKRLGINNNDIEKSYMIEELLLMKIENKYYGLSYNYRNDSWN